MINLRDLVKSFSHALRGVKTMLKTEQSFRFQLLAGAAAVILLLVLPVSDFETVAILLLVVLVLVLEMINSIFERLVDAFKPRLHPVVGEIKDIMAATVLVASFFAAVIGAALFFPHLFVLLTK
jgi:diacylglycerol kinase